jgi:hypothetical protein
VLTTMRFAPEIRSTKQLDLPGMHQGWTDKEMKLARQLMATHRRQRKALLRTWAWPMIWFRSTSYTVIA